MPTNPTRRHGRWIVLPLVLGLAGFLTSCSSGTAATTPTTSPQATLSLALANATSAGWVHETNRTTGSGHSVSMVNDIGTDQGRQVIDSDGAQATALVLSGIAYIQGDANAVSNFFQIPTPDPQKLAGQWISIRPSDQSYAAVSASVTLQSDFQNFQNLFLGPFKAGAQTTVNGVKVVPISGHVQGSTTGSTVPATLFVTASGKVLPVSFRATNSQASITSQWSDWGQAVPLAAPAASIPMSSIVGQSSGATTT